MDVEAEARPRAEMAQRLFEYGSRARIVHGLPVISVVLWLEPGGTPPASPYEERLGDLHLCSWHVIGIEVYRLRAQALLDRGLPGLLPLVPPTAGASDAITVERTAALLKA